MGIYRLPPTRVAGKFGVLATALLVSLCFAGATASAFADAPPKPVRHDPPDYPSDARSREIEGSVEVEFTIGTDGRTKDISVVDAAPPKIFEMSAVRAVQKWTYEPAIRGDAPIEIHQRTKFAFKL